MITIQRKKCTIQIIYEWQPWILGYDHPICGKLRSTRSTNDFTKIPGESTVLKWMRNPLFLLGKFAACPSCRKVFLCLILVADHPSLCWWCPVLKHGCLRNQRVFSFKWEIPSGEFLVFKQEMFHHQGVSDVCDFSKTHIHSHHLVQNMSSPGPNRIMPAEPIARSSTWASTDLQVLGLAEAVEIPTAVAHTPPCFWNLESQQNYGENKYLEKTWSSFTSFSMVCSDLAPVD